MAREKIIIGTTNLIELSQMRDRLTGDYPTDATVEADLLTDPGLAAVSGAQNLPVSVDVDTEGKETAYYGAIPSTVVITEDTLYILRVTATWVSGVDTVVRRFDIDCVGSVR